MDLTAPAPLTTSNSWVATLVSMRRKYGLQALSPSVSFCHGWHFTGSCSRLTCWLLEDGSITPLAPFASLRRRPPPISTRTALSLWQSWDAEDPGPQPHSYPTISDWWDEIMQWKVKKEQWRISGRLLYAIWNAPKQRNKRIFTAKRLTYIEVASIAREDIL
jgi:hypothetical protein